MDIFELTVPLEKNIQNVCSPFEIGFRGYISPSNKANLKKLHQFCKPSVSFKLMCENLSSLGKRKTVDWNREIPFLKTTSE